MNKRLVFSLFAATAMIGAPGAMVTTGATAQTLCGPDAPAEWQRPGGFCGFSAGTGSLTLPGTTTVGGPACDNDGETPLPDCEQG